MALDGDEDRRVVNEDIDAAEGFHSFRRHAVGVFFLRDIDFQRERFPALGANLVGDRLAVENIGDDDRRTFFGQLAAVRRADMARTAGDNGDSPRQPHRPLPGVTGVMEWWSDGSVEPNTPVLQHSSTPRLFIASPFRCSRKSTGCHHGFIPNDSAMTRAAL